MIVELFFIWLITFAEFTSAICRYKSEGRCNGNDFSWHRSGSKYETANKDLYRRLDTSLGNNYTDLHVAIGSMAFFPDSNISKMIIYTTDCKFQMRNIEGTLSMSQFDSTHRSSGHEFQDLDYSMNTASVFSLTNSSALPVPCGEDNPHPYPLSDTPEHLFSSMALGDIDGDGDVDFCIGSTRGIHCYDMVNPEPLLSMTTLKSLDTDEDDIQFPLSSGTRVLSFRYSNNNGNFPIANEARDGRVNKKSGVYRCNDALIALGDVNDDGLIDLLVGSSEFSGIKVFFNKNQSSLLFDDTPDIETGGRGVYTSSYPACSDIDNDGDTDIICSSGSGGTPTVRVHINNGALRSPMFFDSDYFDISTEPDSYDRGFQEGKKFKVMKTRTTTIKSNDEKLIDLDKKLSMQAFLNDDYISLSEDVYFAAEESADYSWYDGSANSGGSGRRLSSSVYDHRPFRQLSTPGGEGGGAGGAVVTAIELSAATSIVEGGTASSSVTFTIDNAAEGDTLTLTPTATGSSRTLCAFSK